MSVYVAAVYHGEGNCQRSVKRVECGNPHHAAQVLIQSISSSDYVELFGWRYEQPWTDPDGRFWAVCSFGCSLGSRIYVYQQIGGFDNGEADLRQWSRS